MSIWVLCWLWNTWNKHTYKKYVHENCPILIFSVTLFKLVLPHPLPTVHISETGWKNLLFFKNKAQAWRYYDNESYSKLHNKSSMVRFLCEYIRQPAFTEHHSVPYLFVQSPAAMVFISVWKLEHIKVPTLDLYRKETYTLYQQTDHE